MPDKARFSFDGRDFELPVLTGTENEHGIDVRQLRANTGLITFDPGFANTGSCESAVTFIDGEKGELRYRGYSIEDLAEHSDFIETAYLLIFGELPTRGERQQFTDMLTDNALLHENLKNHFEGFPADAHPMAMLSAMINALSCYHPELANPDIPETTFRVAAKLISKVRTIAAFSYKMCRGEPFVYPDPNRRYVSNFLHMMYSLPHLDYEPIPEMAKALDLILMLHADHEQNCSTSTVRMVASSGANIFSSVAAGVCALWGRLHGGANMAVIEMLEQIQQGGLDARECLARAKDRNNPFRLMGFGHRVYKNYDPRARILKQACEKLFAKISHEDPLLEIARELESEALEDPYFVERKLYPNVDFYSGLILRAIGIPTNMFTVIFAMGRLPGWIAHWRELNQDKTARIARPRQIYMGERLRKYKPLDKRA